RTRNPQRFPPLHPAPADQHVLDRVVQPVTHVQDRRDVGRRDDDHVTLAVAAQHGAGIGVEIATLLPAAVERRLERLRFVLWREWLRHDPKRWLVWAQG